MKKPITINIFSENIYEDWAVDEKKAIDIARNIFKFYLNDSEIYEKSCLKELDYDTISFDILYCDGEKTHQINKEYREKDYVADIITFAIFADSEPEMRFVFDGEINLGEIMLALDKIESVAEEKGVTREDELYFLISHGMMHLLGFEHEDEESYNFVVDCQKRALEYVKV